MKKPELSPAFVEAGHRHLELVRQHGHHHPLTRESFLEVLEYAPRELKDAMHAKAQAMGLMPKPSAYTADSEPLYNLADMAAAASLTEAEAGQELDAMLQARERMGLDNSGLISDDSDVHRVQ